MSEGNKNYGKEYNMKSRDNNKFICSHCKSLISQRNFALKTRMLELSQTLPLTQANNHLLLQMTENLISFNANT